MELLKIAFLRFFLFYCNQRIDNVHPDFGVVCSAVKYLRLPVNKFPFILPMLYIYKICVSISQANILAEFL